MEREIRTGAGLGKGSEGKSEGMNKAVTILVLVAVLVVAGILFALVESFFLVKPQVSEPEPDMRLRVTGFRDIKPMLETVSLSHGGEFKGTFMNQAGKRITLNTTALSVSKWKGEPCQSVQTDDELIVLGGSFRINAKGCHMEPLKGIVVLKVEIPYTLEEGGETKPYNDMGTIAFPLG